MECIGLVGCPLQEETVAPFRFIQPSGLMMYLRLAQEPREDVGTSGMFPMQFFIAAALIAIHDDRSRDDLTGRP